MSQSSTRLLGLLVAGALTLAGATLPATASAGVYHVYSCRTPSGEPAPTEGWTPEIAQGSAYDTSTANSCETGGSLLADLGDATTHLGNLDRASWTFTAPTFVTVKAADLWIAGDVDGGLSRSPYEYWVSSGRETLIAQECIATLGCPGRGDEDEPLAPQNALAIPAADLGSRIWVSAGCGGVGEGFECAAGAGDIEGFASAVRVYEADFSLEQVLSPEVGEVSGDLATAASVSGAANARFTAADKGAGVYSDSVKVDGAVVETNLLDSNGGRCSNVGGTSDGTMGFLYIRPCAEQVSAAVELDTTDLPNGEHHLEVLVTDAAGNSTPVIDRTIDVANGPSDAETGATGESSALDRPTLSAHWATGGSTASIPFDRAARISGQLSNASGAPIAGGQIEVRSTAASAGAVRSSLSVVRTGSGGAFSIVVPARSSSRRIDLVYRERQGAIEASASTSLSLVVHAGLTLSIAPRVTSVGHSIRFAGRLLGGLVPTTGKLLVLQARAPGGRWLDFNVIRSSRRGYFRAAYRFRFAGPAHYEFRVLCEAEADYPFATGTSPVVKVFER
ncbi:MAG TPA: hypothetical protein VMA83_02105 [Solirubrobacteraceae bacterium]|nr:hypothetical protein [Solirubrobacteraceae bacterium]